MLGFTCQAVRGFPTFSPCSEHVCAGGGGYTGGDYRLCLNIMLLVKCYSRRVVLTAHEVMYDIRYPRQEEAL